MESINKQMIIGLVIHIIIALCYLGSAEYAIIIYLAGSIVLVNVIGLLIIASGNKLLGARVFMISSAIFMPIGLIGAFGARKIIDEEKRKNFYNE